MSPGRTARPMEQLGTGVLFPVHPSGFLQHTSSTSASHLQFPPLLPLHKQWRLTLTLAGLPGSSVHWLQHEEFLVVKDEHQSVL